MDGINVTHSKHRKLGLFSLGALALGVSLGTSSQVWAGAGVTDTPDSCTGINCGSQSINATYTQNQFGQSLPFTTQVFVPGGFCVRLEVTSQGSGGDLEMVLVSPNGTVWRDDDSAGNNRPLIKVNAAPVFGWYNLQVSHFAGTGATTNFILRYGLYTSGNPNCSSPTPGM